MEVLIGIMILTAAIVSATNLLVGLMQSNQNNLTTLQAYYFAQEGLEAVRNVRDSNWLHNQNWLGSAAVWGEELKIGNEYAIELKPFSFNMAPSERTADFADAGEVGNSRPWGISSAAGADFLRNIAGEETVFKRVVGIKPYDNHVLVESKVSWNLGGKDRELVLSEILTDWKGGAL